MVTQEEFLQSYFTHICSYILDGIHFFINSLFPLFSDSSLRSFPTTITKSWPQLKQHNNSLHLSVAAAKYNQALTGQWCSVWGSGSIAHEKLIVCVSTVYFERQSNSPFPVLLCSTKHADVCKWFWIWWELVEKGLMKWKAGTLVFWSPWHGSLPLASLINHCIRSSV